MAAAVIRGKYSKLLLPCITSTFNNTITTTRRFITSLPPSRAPWLLLPQDMEGRQMYDGCDNFYYIVDKRLIKLQHKHAYGLGERNLTCMGTSQGSLIFLHDNSLDFYTIYPYIRCHSYLAYKIGGHSSKIQFSQADSILMALLTCEDEEFDAFLVRNPRWKYYDELFRRGDPPMMYCAKNETVYKLSMDATQRPRLQLLEVFEEELMFKSGFNIGGAFGIDGQDLLPSNITTPERELRRRCHQDRYLVVTERFGEDDPKLYLLIRHHNRELLGFAQTRAVDVFRFDFEEKRVTYTKKLDNHAFFIGSGSEAFAVSVKDCPGLSPDSVYIADDLSVFNLEEKCLTPFFNMGDLSMTRPQTFWVAPPTVDQLTYIATQFITDDIETTPVNCNGEWERYGNHKWEMDYLDWNLRINEYDYCDYCH